MKIFLDANVLISVLNQEYPLFTYSARVLSLADKPNYQLCTSPLCLAIAFYFASKKCGHKKAKEKISLLASKIHLLDIINEDVSNALINKKIDDFEDGIQYYSSLRNSCQYIITEDLNDFHYSEIKVFGCKDFLANYIKK